MNKNIRIGVLGGIGPEATGEFYNNIISRLQAGGLIDSNTDFPHILINSIPAPELIYANIADSDLLPYIEGLKELDSMNVDFIVMVCNTIHLFYERLQKEIKTPILDLRCGLNGLLTKKGVKTTCTIGTPNSIKHGLYCFEGIRSLKPDEGEMKQLSDAIFSFNRGIDKDVQTQKVRDICQKYVEQGAETIILGCTEFAVMLKDDNLPLVNTIDLLAEMTVRKVKEC